MKRDLSVERLYYLGDYKNIKFGSVTKDIPEELALNNRAEELIFLQQFLACEMAYRKYIDMLEKINEDFGIVRSGKRIVDPEKVAEFLQEQRVQTLKELLAEAKGLVEEKEQKDES